MTGTTDTQARYYAGIRMVSFDLLKELVLALLGVAVLIVVLAAVVSAPDVPPVTIGSWSQADPVDFVTTASAELAGQSGTAQYGPPYNSTPDAAQALGPIVPQDWAGISTPIDTAKEFVLHPLELAATGIPTLTSALDTYNGADATQQQAWLDSYTKALGSATVENGQVTVAAGDYGPVPTLVGSLLGIARSGGLDGLLLENGRFFQTDFTRPAALHGRRQLHVEPGRRPAPDRGPVGRDERNGQLPRPDVAVALLGVVPASAVQHGAERRSRDRPDRPGADHAAGPGPVHTDPARHPPLGTGPQVDLAALLPLGVIRP